MLDTTPVTTAIAATIRTDACGARIWMRTRIASFKIVPEAFLACGVKCSDAATLLLSGMADGGGTAQTPSRLAVAPTSM